MNTIQDLTSYGLPAVPVKERATEMGQEQFMTLMIAQFQNQDPMKPMENGDFLGQLAQFGTVSGIDELKTSFQAIAGALYEDQTLQASTMIDRNVLVDSDVGYLPAGGALDGAVDLPSASGDVVVEVRDAGGEVVRRMSLGRQPAGLADFRWDGITNDGRQAAAGNYQIVARMEGADGYQAVPTLVSARVDSVTLGRTDNRLTLNLDGLPSVGMEDVRQIG